MIIFTVAFLIALQCVIVQSFLSPRIDLRSHIIQLSLGDGDCAINFDDSFVECSSQGKIVSWKAGEAEPLVNTRNLLPSIFKDATTFLHKMSVTLKHWSRATSSPENVILISDAIDEETSPQVSILLRNYRRRMLVKMLKKDRNLYLTTVEFMINRIPRHELPNLQNVPLPKSERNVTIAGDDEALVEDCSLQKVGYQDSPFDKFMLRTFRRLVQKEIEFSSSKPGISGLLEEGRYFKLSAKGQENDSINQHRYVKNVLSQLMTPILPPLFRIFMAGLIPSEQRGDPKWLVDGCQQIVSKIPDSWPIKAELYLGKQFGPWFYADFLTSAFTPFFMKFLVGPMRTNRRKDGLLGGMVIEKCKFLQESNCKGLCLHQCKIPAEELFRDTLGINLTVSPNFETQECQWSWGEQPLHHKDDPDFPKGCIRGCETRKFKIRSEFK